MFISICVVLCYVVGPVLGFAFSSSSFAHKTWSHIPSGFVAPREIDGSLLKKRPRKPAVPIEIHSVSELRDIFSKGHRVQDLDVRGNVASLLQEPSVHPAVKALYERKEDVKQHGERKVEDAAKIAIAIEGGGMRGCVAAGMITAFDYLGLKDSIDVIYGSSAGSLVGAYYISGQSTKGLEVYYDVLTTAGKDFIDLQSALRSLGLGMFDLRFKSLAKLFTDRLGNPVLNLDYLLETIAQKVRPLNWTAFWEKQVTNKLPLKIVTSGLLTQESVVLSAKDGNFATMPQLAECLRASMMIPGVAGEVVRLKGTQAAGTNIHSTEWPEYRPRQRKPDMVFGSEPYADALIFEPLPYRSALKENCTHVIVLRTRSDNVRTTVKAGLIERTMTKRFFGNKQNLPSMVNWMHNQYHKLIYAEDMLVLNAANRDFSEIIPGTARLYAIANAAEACPEVNRLETSRAVIFEAVRCSFASAYDALVLNPSDRGKGYEIARTIWPDSILSEPPKHLQTNSAEPSSVENTCSNNTMSIDTAVDSTQEVIEAALRKEGVQVSVSKRAAVMAAMRKFYRHIVGP
eukprot:gene10127-11864_t